MLFLLNLPILYVSLRGVEVDAHLGDWQTRQGEALAILSEVDLVHSRLCALVQLQLHQEEVGLRH